MKFILQFTGPEVHQLAMAMLKSMGSLMQGSQSAKELFKNKIGYTKFVEALKSLGQPSMELLKSVLSLVSKVELYIYGSALTCFKLQGSYTSLS
jgi:hypothetical protein